MKNVWMSLLLCMIFCLPFASLPDKFIDNDFEKVKVTKKFGSALHGYCAHVSRS